MHYDSDKDVSNGMFGIISKLIESLSQSFVRNNYTARLSIFDSSAFLPGIDTKNQEIKYLKRRLKGLFYSCVQDLNTKDKKLFKNVVGVYSEEKSLSAAKNLHKNGWL